MQRVSTTVIGLMGDQARACARALQRAPNIRVELPDQVAVADTLARWRARTIELPDYYLVLAPESWAPTRRHWYLGVLARSAPARVVPTDPSSAARVQAAIATLASGRWWPELDRLLADVDRVVPDRV
jgi:hypothetical protein